MKVIRYERFCTENSLYKGMFSTECCLSPPGHNFWMKTLKHFSMCGWDSAAWMTDVSFFDTALSVTHIIYQYASVNICRNRRIWYFFTSVTRSTRKIQSWPWAYTCSKLKPTTFSNLYNQRVCSRVLLGLPGSDTYRETAYLLSLCVSSISWL